MESPREWWSRLRVWAGGEAGEREMDEEMRFHLEELTAKNVRAGMSPEEARRAARVSFGGVERFKEEARDEARPRWLEDLARDVRYGLRTLARNPGFTGVVVLTLGLGIGANTAIWSVVDGVLLRPVPLAEADRLMVVWETDRDSGTTREPASVPDYLDFARQSTRFGRLAAFSGAEVNLTPVEGEPSRLAALAVSHDYLPLLGLRPLLGRGFTPADDRLGAADVVLIGEGLWQRLFARDRGAVGRTLRLDGRPHTVLGVVPDSAGFGSLQLLSAADYSRAFADRGRDSRVEVWVPLRPDPEESPRSTHPIFLLGRLALGATPAAAQQEMTTLAEDLERRYPENQARGAFVEPLTDVVFGPVRPALLVLVGAVALALLAACANIATLLFARGAARLGEVTVRTVLGAGRDRLVRQFLVEGALLTLAGVSLGLLFAELGLQLLLALAPPGIPRLSEVGIDGRVLGVTLGVSVLVALAVGLVPAAQARRLDLQSPLRDGAGRGGTRGRASGRLRALLVVAEVALAVVLLAGAGLLLKSFWQLRQVDPGFHSAGVLKAEVQLPATRYPRDFGRWPDWPEQQRFFAGLLERARAMPGVEAAALAGNHPLDPGFTNSFYVVGRREEAAGWPEISIRRMSPGYFEALRVPLVEGRLPGTADAPSAPPVVWINQATARRFFPRGNPLGQKIAFWGTERTIVGIVGDERSHGLLDDPPPAVYAPIAQVPSADGAVSLVVRAAGEPAALAPAVREAIRELDPELAVFGVEPLAETLADSIGKQRFTLLLVALFAGLSLGLAVVGIYGILRYLATRRAPEMGLRMALGASPGEVEKLIVRQGAGLALWGLGLGLLGALAATRLLQSLLFGVAPTDLATFAAVLALVLAAVLLASWLPARRATREDPMALLRAG